MTKSGVNIEGTLAGIFETRMKLGREFKIMAFRLNETSTEIVLDEANSITRKNDDGSEKFPDELAWRNQMEDILASLGKESRFFIYDVEFTAEAGIVNQKPILLMWNPEGAPTRQKMVLTATKVEFHDRVCPGLVAKQATTASEAMEALNDVK